MLPPKLEICAPLHRIIFSMLCFRWVFVSVHAMHIVTIMSLSDFLSRSVWGCICFRYESNNVQICSLCPIISRKDGVLWVETCGGVPTERRQRRPKTTKRSVCAPTRVVIGVSARGLYDAWKRTTLGKFRVDLLIIIHIIVFTNARVYLFLSCRTQGRRRWHKWEIWGRAYRG